MAAPALGSSTTAAWEAGHRRLLAALWGPAAAWLVGAGACLSLRAADPEAVAARGRPAFSAVAGSEDCRRCHPAQHASWHRTFHRTMTQPIETAAVLAPFSGEQLARGGVVATMDRDADGRPTVRVTAGDTTWLEARVDLTVGSHRYQQYVARIDRGGGAEERFRLPVAWHRAQRRWIHINDAFVEPAEDVGDREGYLRHLSRWNDNCVFCHNTQPVPGVADPAPIRGRVAEYGIACEACHGPARAHAAFFADPFARLALAGATVDRGVTHPARATPERAAGLCGRCHGQRIAQDAAYVLAHGDGFVAGDDLTLTSRPIFADSKIAGMPALDFSARFWPDGSPRLSAYEYQGLLLSPCYARGEPTQVGGALECGHCHAMHGEDLEGQVRSGRSGAGGCVDCHVTLAREGGGAADGLALIRWGAASAGADPRARPGRAAFDAVAPATIGAHARHAQAAPEVACGGCHMPRTTYGLLEGMISHRINNPEPWRWLGRDDQPDACTQCHVDRSRRWAAEALVELGFPSPAPTDWPTPAEHEAWASRVVLDALGGDALQRNLAAHALAQRGATGPLRDRMAVLAEIFEDDYASVRWFAWVELRGGVGLVAPACTQAADALDPHAPIEARAPAAQALRACLGPTDWLPSPERVEWLRQERADVDLWIGE